VWHPGRLPVMGKTDATAGRVVVRLQDQPITHHPRGWGGVLWPRHAFLPRAARPAHPIDPAPHPDFMTGVTGSQDSHTKVAIFGAGLSGMSAAFHLRRAGVGCRIFERLPHPGGHVVTVAEDGYRFDRTGHLLHVQDQDIRELALDWIGADHRWVDRRSVVWSHGRYTRYPFQANAYGLPPEVAKACVLGFIEAHGRDPGPLHDFEQFCMAKFGKGISDHFMIPYNTRLWGVEPNQISADWCQRFVPIPTVEDVIAGAVGVTDRELGYNTRFVYPTQGIGRLSEGLAAAVGDIELGRSVRRIDTSRKLLHFDDERVSYDVLINTMPLPRFIDLCVDAAPAVTEAASQLRCTHLYYLDVALRSPCQTPYHWIYVPESRYPFYRVGCYSHFSAAMAPPGKACLYVELVDRQEPELATLLPDLARGLVDMGVIAHPEAIAFARVRKLDHAFVIFDHAYEASLAVVKRFLSERQITTTGRYGGWNYSAMSDAIGFGCAAATGAAAMLDDGGQG
jgi:protoporphyrinogen oxidase